MYLCVCAGKKLFVAVKDNWKVTKDYPEYCYTGLCKFLKQKKNNFVYQKTTDFNETMKSLGYRHIKKKSQRIINLQYVVSLLQYKNAQTRFALYFKNYKKDFFQKCPKGSRGSLRKILLLEISRQIGTQSYIGNVHSSRDLHESLHFKIEFFRILRNFQQSRITKMRSVKVWRGYHKRTDEEESV